jgi:uncharacterized protein YbaR (Trm112 family)
MAIASELLDVLVCPESRASMIYFPEGEDGGFLFCPSSKLKYRIEAGIPVLLVEEAERVDDSEAEKLSAEAEQRELSRTGEAGS